MHLPLFPLRTVLFPGMLLPLHIFEPRYRELVRLCLQERQPFGVALIRSGQETGAPATPYPIGTFGHITRVEHQRDGHMNIKMLGQERFRILDIHHDQPYLTATAEKYPLRGGDEPAARRAANALNPWLNQYIQAIGRNPEPPVDSASLPLGAAAVAYLAAIIAQIPMEEKQALLAEPDALSLLERERAIFRREISLARAVRARLPDTDTTFLNN